MFKPCAIGNTKNPSGPCLPQWQFVSFPQVSSETALNNFCTTAPPFLNFLGFSGRFKKRAITTEKSALRSTGQPARREPPRGEKTGRPKRRGGTDLRDVFYRCCKTDRERLACRK
jgi:hypothetical protein